jgi:hypothetical protein
MTLEQLAENYGVSVSEIERIVGTAVDGGSSAALATELVVKIGRLSPALLFGR